MADAYNQKKEKCLCNYNLILWLQVYKANEPRDLSVLIYIT